MLKETKFYEKLENKKVKCGICPHFCTIPEDKKGFCRTRINKDGKCYSNIYGLVSSMAVDPIEKKPLFNFHPGSRIFSISSVGCNFRCLNCQNYHISQSDGDKYPNLREVSPKDIVKAAKRNNCSSIAYTYNEPIIWLEFVHDTGKLAHEKEIENVLVTNGYVSAEGLHYILPYIDAANVDIKSMSDDFYREICKVKSVDPVLRTVKTLYENSKHVECTNLIIPGKNDKKEDFKKLAEWILNECGPDVPLHFSRFRPMYQLDDIPPTPKKTIDKARDIAMDVGLYYVYVGNIYSDQGEITFCPECKKPVIRRRGYSISEIKLENGKCPHCGNEINVVE
ncbi:MAG: AmmeMemoRadiSam system radical SAM enzyme [Candidatus Lokiarchaeota archaeon]|nr:AmmeMemoRadiSam system radical SAM enzyme [Candidatus Lokiarchaeota archaeon]